MKDVGLQTCSLGCFAVVNTLPNYAVSHPRGLMSATMRTSSLSWFMKRFKMSTPSVVSWSEFLTAVTKIPG
jgi:hypothetical protein